MQGVGFRENSRHSDSVDLNTWDRLLKFTYCGMILCLKIKPVRIKNRVFLGI